LLYPFIRGVLMDGYTIPLLALFLGGIALVVFELWYKEKPHVSDDIGKITYSNALLIGLFQSFAIIPGISRAAATIIGGLVVKLQRKTAVEFSFLLAVPTILAATVLDIVLYPLIFSGNQMILFFVGFAVSFFVALMSISFLIRFIKTRTFISFGIYRIILVILFWFLVF